MKYIIADGRGPGDPVRGVVSENGTYIGSISKDWAAQVVEALQLLDRMHGAEQPLVEGHTLGCTCHECGRAWLEENNAKDSLLQPQTEIVGEIGPGTSPSVGAHLEPKKYRALGDNRYAGAVEAVQEHLAKEHLAKGQPFGGSVCTCLLDDSPGMASGDPYCPVHGVNKPGVNKQ